MSKINLHNYEAFLIDYLDGSLNKTSIVELKAFVLANPQLEIDLEQMDLPYFADDDTKIDFKNELKKTENFISDEEIINYLENKLSEVEHKIFESNLLINKELAIKFEAYKKTILSSDSTLSIGKTTLYKTEDDLILNNLALAYTENQLSITDKLNFEKELKANAILQREFASFQKTKLIADKTIVFENKEALKKKTKVVALFSFRAVASMAAAILLLIGLAFMFNNYNTKPAFAKELAKNNLNKTLNNIKYQIVKTVDSSDKLNNAALKNNNLVAKNTNSERKNKLNNNIQQINLNEPKTTSVAATKDKKELDPVINKDPENAIKEAVANNKSIVDTNNANLANSNLSELKYTKQHHLIAVEENDDEENPPVTPVKKGFWQRAVKLAKQVNKLGVKAIDGDEAQGKNYSLSFNSFSVEKR